MSSEVLPEAVSFDGAENLNRSSDLTGNADGKTFTFSCWLYTNGTPVVPYYSLPSSGSVGSFLIKTSSSGVLTITSRISGSTLNNLYLYNPSVLVPANTWSHVLVSIDMANLSGSKLYINDKESTFLTYPFTNTSLNFTNPVHRTGHQTNGRLAHVFLDYTYRDLSTTSNRRLFIDADGKPSSTIPSNPILYLPMTDAATAGSNSGTGGDFTAAGTLATAERGPNQDNCSASVFDGSNDYLSSSGIGAISSKVITFSMNWNQNVHKSSSPHYLITFNSYNVIYITGNKLGGYFRNSSNGDVVNIEMDNALYSYPIFKIHKNISMCIDVDDVNKCKMLINGQVVAATFTIVSATNISIPNGTTEIGRNALDTSDGTVGANLGEFYFNNAYIDLATDNPFWDSDLGKPNSVRKVIADTGVTPLIAMPLIGSDAGNNLGSGGDFTVNSGPYTGARGGSEFFARSADFNGSTGYLSKSSALTGATDSDAVTIAFAINPSAIGDDGIFGFGNYRQYLYRSSSGTGLGWAIRDSSGNNILSTTSFSIADYTGVGTWDIYLMSCDLSASQAKVYKNGVSTGTFSFYAQSSNAPSYAAQGFALGGMDPTSAGDVIDAEFGGFYFATSYTDFSQEANRNKFVDQLGYLKDLTPAIEAGDIPTPLVYMKFDPTVSLGTNSGTGGNLTVNGGVVAGADVKS